MAAQNVTGQGNIGLSFIQTNTTGLIVPNQATAPFTALINLINGTGVANAVDTLYGAQLTLAAAPTTINLNAATDISSNSVSFKRVRFWGVQVVTITAGFIVNIYTVTATNPLTWLPQVLTGTLWAPPGGIVMGYDPLSVTTNGYVVSASANTFVVNPGANTVVANVVIAGNSAA
jgi:hypothetical protein